MNGDMDGLSASVSKNFKDYFSTIFAVFEVPIKILKVFGDISGDVLRIIFGLILWFITEFSWKFVYITIDFLYEAFYSFCHDFANPIVMWAQRFILDPGYMIYIYSD